MLGAIRRCSAALPRTVSSISTISTRSATFYNTTNAVRSSKTVVTPIRAPSLARAYHATQICRAAEAAEAAGEGEAITRFEDLEKYGMVNRNIIRTLTHDMGMETMTEVQTATINEALKGTDMYGYQ